MALVLENEDEFRIERSGPFDRIQQRIGLIRGESPSIARRILWSIAVTWVPLLVLSLLQGRAFGPSPRESFLLDFAAYARFLVCIPLLIAAESLVGPQFTHAARTFLRTGLVRAKDQKRLEAAFHRAVRLRESGWAELVMLALAVFGSWNLTVESWYGSDSPTWRVVGGGGRLSLAGLWYHAVAIPLLQFLWLRWLWRLAVWTRFLYDVSRLDLDFVPTHADGAGGLGFLGNAHGYLGILALAMGTLLAADAAFRIVYEGAKLKGFESLLLVFLAVCLLLFLGPLALFTPKLERARREGLRTYGALMARYNRAFHEKWTEGRAPEGEQLLGTSDIQSLADLGNSYDRIKKMRIVPASSRPAVRILWMGGLPALLPILLVVPLVQILKRLAKAVF